MAEKGEKSDVAKRTSTADKSATAVREEEILKFWQENDIFKKSLEKESPKGEFVFYDGPPFATGTPHHGHLLGSTSKDLFGRYKTMQGHHVRRRWGWDTHGLPIESLVEKKLGLKTKKDILEVGIEKFNSDARAMVLDYVAEWKRYIERLGRWVDFDNSYKTMDKTFMESVWWAISELHKKGKLYEGRKVLMYCPHCETPLAKAEIAMDNTYHDVTEEAVTVEFRVKGKENTSMLAWTTTPWTLPGNVALAVGSGIDYVTIEKRDEGSGPLVRFILAKERLEAVFGDNEYEIVEEYKGSTLVGLEYEPLFDIPAISSSDKAYRVYPADFVSTEEGTGIVHTAVMYGEDDFKLGEKEDLPMVPLLDASGVYNEHVPDFLQGKYIKDAEEAIKSELEKRSLLFDKAMNTHSYPHCYRCGTPLIYNAVPSWFVDIQSVKEKLLSENEKIHWVPEHLKHGRFKNIIEGAPDWTVSRNRFWATPLPIWKNEETGEVVVIGSIEELKERAVGDVPEDLHRPYIDEIKLKGEKGGELTRIPEVVDCWLESGSMPFAEYHYPFDNKEAFEKRTPGDFVSEYIAQTRTWYYYMHAMSVHLFGHRAFNNVVNTGTILASDGEKMSKSVGNFTDPFDLFNQYGSDAFRHYLMSSVVMQGEDFSFRDDELRDVHNRVVNILRNVFAFYKLYEKDAPDPSGESVHVLDRWILARFFELHASVTESLDQFDTVRATRPIREFIDDFSTWFVRRSRDRVKSEDKADKEAALATLRYVLRKFSKLIAPVMPFVADEIFRGVRRDDDPESVHLTNWCSVRDFDQQILDDMKKVRDVVSLALEARASAGIKVRQPLASLTVKSATLADELVALIRDEVNVKEVVFDESIENEVELDTHITEELKREGMVRDLIRHIQQARKNAGCTPEDRVALVVQTSEEGKKFVEEFKDQIQKTALLKDITFADVSGESIRVGDEEEFTLKLEK